MLRSQYHGCWCPGDARSQRIRNHDIDLVKPRKLCLRMLGVNRRQAIIWTNDGLIYWCVYVSLGQSELNLYNLHCLKFILKLYVYLPPFGDTELVEVIEILPCGILAFDNLVTQGCQVFSSHGIDLKFLENSEVMVPKVKTQDHFENNEIIIVIVIISYFHP